MLLWGLGRSEDLLNGPRLFPPAATQDCGACLTARLVNRFSAQMRTLKCVGKGARLIFGPQRCSCSSPLTPRVFRHPRSFPILRPANQPALHRSYRKGRRSRDMPRIYAPFPNKARRNETKRCGPLNRKSALPAVPGFPAAVKCSTGAAFKETGCQSTTHCASLSAQLRSICRWKVSD